MDELIGSPLKAACNAQIMLAQSTLEFIENVAFVKSGNETKIRMVEFSYESNESIAEGEGKKEVKLNVPFISIVSTPNLLIDKINITFDMEVKSATVDKGSTSTEAGGSGSVKAGFGPFSAKVNFYGKVASHKENVRQTDKSAKYHVEVSASQAGTPEGLSRMLDMLNNVIVPQPVAATNK
ncbi:MAG: DUF2589 domain-containing protein [Ectobacillus sp.]